MIQALLNDGTFTPRVISRNPESNKAKALVALGVEVVKADLGDTKSLEIALRGAEGVFAVSVTTDALICLA